MRPAQQQPLPAGYVEASSFIEGSSTQSILSSREEAPMASAARVSTTSNPATGPTTSVAESSKATVSRDGIRGGKRWDNQPKVYRELPSFPKFDQPIPNDASIEEICIRYPNHIRGTYLAAFVQWHWTSHDIYNRLTDVAKQEFIDNGIATCKSKNNRTNFISKRLEAYLKAHTDDEIAELCTQPKLRPCLMNGGEKKGKSKLMGKFNNPNAQPVRHIEYTPRSGANKRKAAEDLPQKPEAKKPKAEARSDTLWESMEVFEEYKYAMAGYWRKQVSAAQTIVNADVVHANADVRQRVQQVLQMLRYPVNSMTETFLTFERIEDCAAFAAFIDNKVRAVFDDLRARETGAASLEVRNKAVDAILQEQGIIATSLQKLVPLAASAFESGQLKFGLVRQAIQAVTNAFAERTGKPGNAAQSFNALHEAHDGSGTLSLTAHDGQRPKRVREETPAEEASNKRAKTALTPGFSLAGKSMQQVFGAEPGPQVFNTQQAFEPVGISNRLEDAPGLGRDFDLVFEEIYGGSTAPSAPSHQHGQPTEEVAVPSMSSLQQTQNMVPTLGMAVAEGTSRTEVDPSSQARTEDEILQEYIDMLPSLPPTPEILYDQTDFYIVPQQNQVATDTAYLPQHVDMLAQTGEYFLQGAHLTPWTDLPGGDETLAQTSDLSMQYPELFAVQDPPQPEVPHDGMGMFDAAIEDLAPSSDPMNVNQDWNFGSEDLTASELRQMQDDPAFWDGMFNNA
ncbi:hypothetical protein EDD37DRAFT_333491 [Exophiala viscosa]|uniref:uncharacterized protein n=1 Tax=Exophiala viscosa TaxID=2486360 RepID=UPI002195C821|nr:hypothetical protein EDD37DRAFT_333491 [Exophiala viscosa]